MGLSEEPKDEQEAAGTAKEEELVNGAETQETEASAPSRWLLWAVILAAAGIVLLLLYNFLHRASAP